MNVYFVRHGEGEHNVKKLYSLKEFKLTKKGQEQAAFLAKRLGKLPIELIISSTFTRAFQTTEIINKELKTKVVFSDLAVEIRRPKEIAGKFQHDPDVTVIKDTIDKNFHLPNYHYSDEENFYDLKKRAFEFIKYLEKIKQNNILVVSHAHFIRMAVFAMILDKHLTPEIFLKICKVFYLETSGLTVCEKNEKGWKLITWNDYAHI